MFGFVLGGIVFKSYGLQVFPYITFPHLEFEYEL